MAQNMSHATETQTSAAGATKTVKTSSGTNLVLGLWLIIAPFLLGYGAIPGPMWNDVLIGIIIAALAALRLSSPGHSGWASWTNLVAGLWLIIAPFVIAGYTAAATWNDIIVGIIAASLAAASGAAARKLS
jgi:hypothetical protein